MEAFGFDLTRPLAMWLIVLVVPALLWFHFRSLSDFPKWQRWTSLAIRSVIVLLMMLAIAGLVLLRNTDRQMVVVAIDRSDSIDESARTKAGEIAGELQQLADRDPLTEIRFLPFAREPSLVVDRWSTEDAVGTLEITETSTGQADLQTGNSELAGSATTDSESGEVSEAVMGTNIASAIRTAAASIPPSYVPKIVVISDGNSTRGDELAAAGSAEVPIWTLSTMPRSEPEVQLAALRAPAQVRQGEPFFLEVIVNANHDATGYIDIYRGDIKIGESDAAPVEVKPGETKFRIRQTISGQRQVTFSARLRGFSDGDTLLGNNESTALVSASGRPRVLLIDPDTQQTDALRWALDEQKIDVEIRPPEGVPRGLTELQGYECLILSNVPATAMTMRQMDVIRTYVQDLGGGLIMLGGDQSFGLGGYYRTQLEEILPVRSNFEKEREKPSLAMVLVIDKSGSMGGEKIELAKDAARAAVELLGPRDSIGVIAFDGDSYWISELRSVSDKGYVIDQISTIDAGGGTNMFPAMEDAYQALTSSSAKLKHCIMLADGHSQDGDFESLASEMSASRMTVSTVSLGQDANEELMEEIARIGGGRYYFCDDPNSVPQVFAKETVEASKSAINELPFMPQLVRPTQVLEGIDIDLSPLLLGYVVTRPKPTSEFILASENGDPLLVWWRYGLGMTVAFTSDAKARWASEWLAWPDFGTFWAQVIRHAMRKNETRGVFVEIEQVDGDSRVIMDTVDDQGKFVNDAPTALTVIGPQLKAERIELEQTAPGRYEASFDTPRRGSYQLDLAQTRGDGQTMRQARGVVVGYHDELRLLPTNDESLRRVAELSGGQYNAPLDQVLPADGRNARWPQPLWPWLLMTALGLFVVDVALRRIELR